MHPWALSFAQSACRVVSARPARLLTFVRCHRLFSQQKEGRRRQKRAGGVASTRRSGENDVLRCVQLTFASGWGCYETGSDHMSEGDWHSCPGRSTLTCIYKYLLAPTHVPSNHPPRPLPARPPLPAHHGERT
ncbi:hypothetical protein BV20DRAFT_964100 [Pilatotrama ljubarskyi]|nr:hypothetical protein BV20DRAFT_964100 [Pilatotrama ljubarskyi]